MPDGPALRVFEYDVCLSFAGDDRDYVREVADALTQRGIRVFYDEYKQADLWGKNLYDHLADVYSNAARYCVMFASKHYARKIWTTHERRSSQERALQEHAEYILPCRFDDTEIPGLASTIAYVDLRSTSCEELAALIETKLGKRDVREFFPPYPDLLLKELEADEEDLELVASRAERFFLSLTRMSPDERKALSSVFVYGCPVELPENVHIDIDLLRRVTDFPRSKIKRVLGKLSSLGFEIGIKQERGHHQNQLGGPSELVYVVWSDRSVHDSGNGTEIADAMFKVVMANYCTTHAEEALEKLDFSSLSSTTVSPDAH